MKALRELDLKALSRLTGTPVAGLRDLSSGTDRHYLRQPHLTSSGKTRMLLIPRPELKRIQRRIYRRLLRPLPPHPDVACVRGRGVHWVVRQHAARPFLLHEDLADFFPSVTRDRVTAAFLRIGTRPETADLLSGLFTAEDGLPQGAPTSTAVGDLVLYPLDRRLGSLARVEGLTYTRYVDDLAFSGGRRLVRRFRPLIRKIVAEEGWVLNEKGGVSGPDARHLLLGTVLNGAPNATSEYRKNLRSILRLAQDDRVTLSDKEWRSVRSKVEWVYGLNPRAGSLLQRYLPPAPAAS